MRKELNEPRRSRYGSVRMDRLLVLACLALALAATAVFSAGCDGGSDCPDAAALQARLDGAAPGTTISIGACRLRGPLAIPAGVTLSGAGPSSTIIDAPAGSIGVTLEPSSNPATPTTLTDVAVESTGCAGVVARGSGAVALARDDVRPHRGIGIGIEDATSVALEDVVITGAVTTANADATLPPSAPFTCESTDPASHGLVLVRVADARLDRVRADGLAAFGALFVSSTVTWTGGGARTNLGTGIEVWGGRAALESIELADTRDGLGAIESFDAVFAGGASVETSALSVIGGDSYGMLHDGATARHVDLVASGNGFAGVWAQGTTGVEISGSSSIEDNGFAGVAALDATGVVVRGATIARTVERIAISGVRTIRAADGTHLVRSTATLDSVTLRDNARVGLLVELGGASTSSIGLTSITVDGSGTELGAIAQNGTISAAWDSGVTRLGATATNDAAFSGALDIAGAVGPPCLPPLSGIDASGIGALLMR